MNFGKSFFDGLSALTQKYLSIFSCGFITVTLKAYDQEYNLEKILQYDDSLVSFTYYATEKSRKMPTKIAERTGEPMAWPALTIPFTAIQSIEFNPSDGELHIVKGKQIGFFRDISQEGATDHV